MRVSRYQSKANTKRGNYQPVIILITFNVLLVTSFPIGVTSYGFFTKFRRTPKLGTVKTLVAGKSVANSEVYCL